MTYPVIDMVETGRRIGILREHQGLSVRELAHLLGFASPQAIYKWQHGETLPSLDNLVALSTIFAVPIEEILVFHEIA